MVHHPLYSPIYNLYLTAIGLLEQKLLKKKKKDSNDVAISAEVQSLKQEQLYTTSAHDNKLHTCGRIAHV